MYTTRKYGGEIIIIREDGEIYSSPKHTTSVYGTSALAQDSQSWYVIKRMVNEFLHFQ